MRFQAHFLISKLGCCLAQPWMGCTYLKGRGYRNTKTRSRGWLQGNIVFCIHQGRCTCELTMTMTACTKPVQAQANIYLCFVCMCLYVFTCYHMHHGVLVRVRGRLLRTGTVFPACFHPGLNSDLRLGSRRFYPWNHFTCLRNIPMAFFLDIWHRVHRKESKYTLQLDIQMPWWHFHSNNELGLLSTSLRLWAPTAGFQLGIIETRIFRVFYDFFPQHCPGSPSALSKVALGVAPYGRREGSKAGAVFWRAWLGAKGCTVCEEVASPSLY